MLALDPPPVLFTFNFGDPVPTHISIDMASHMCFNPEAAEWRFRKEGPHAHGPSPALSFHRLLPDYSESRLHSLPSLASELGVGHVLIKDESNRFGLPSFKVLGASWAVYRAVAHHLGCDVDGEFDDGNALERLAARAKGSELRIVTATAGNWGRAVARMAKYLGVRCMVHVPSDMPETTRALIRGEGAEVVGVEDGDYDVAAEAAKRHGQAAGSLLVLDIGWEGFEAVPKVCLSNGPRESPPRRRDSRC